MKEHSLVTKQKMRIKKINNSKYRNKYQSTSHPWKWQVMESKNCVLIKNWMHAFVALLVCESIE